MYTHRRKVRAQKAKKLHAQFCGGRYHLQLVVWGVYVTLLAQELMGGTGLIVRRLLLAVLVLLGAIQFIRPARTNPPVEPSKTIDAALTVNPAAAAVLERSCKDCHSIARCGHGTA